MKVEIRLFASLARYLPVNAVGRSGMVDIPPNTTIIQNLKQLDVPLEQVKIIFLNGRHATGEEILQEGDRVGVFPPVAGG